MEHTIRRDGDYCAEDPPAPSAFAEAFLEQLKNDDASYPPEEELADSDTSEDSDFGNDNWRQIAWKGAYLTQKAMYLKNQAEYRSLRQARREACETKNDAPES